MTEEEAREWIAQRYPQAIPALEQFLTLLREEAARQNLVSASTLPHIWARHVVDSAQLVALATDPAGPWLDIGSGAGFPGLVLAILTGAPVLCVEPRARRVEWLRRAAAELALPHVTVEHVSLAHVATQPVATITARAVAPLPKLFAMAARFATPDTCWLFPKGSSARRELDEAKVDWHGVFHVEHSLTDPAAGIVVAERIAPKGRRTRP